MKIKLWLPEITKVRIRFQNYLFDKNKRISCHLGHNRIFPADNIAALLATGNNASENQILENIFQADKEKAIFRIYLEDIIPMILSGPQKWFLDLYYFLMTKSLSRAKQRF